MTEFGRFLRARRGGISPADVGLPGRTGPRRTPGLRREEVAALAGVSIDYYVRLERGKETRPSPSVVDALAEALRLNCEERNFLRELAATAARQAPEPRALPSRRVRPTMQMMLETLRPNPAYVVSRTNDLLAANPGGLRLLHGIEDWPEKQRNTIRYTFLHPAARELWNDWDRKAQDCVAQLRAIAGTDPDAPDLATLVGELIVKSPDFNRHWERYEVRTIGDGEKTVHHPEVGTMTLSHEALTLNRAQGQRLIVYLATPGTPDHDAMTLLDLVATPRPPRTGTTSSAGSTAQATASPSSDPTTPLPDPARSHDRPPHAR